MISLKPYNTYQLDAYAQYVYFPQTIKEILDIYAKHDKVVLLGNGSNVILAKTHYNDTAFIIMQGHFDHIYAVNEGIYAQAGVLLKSLAMHAYESSLSGVETFFDVPASIGGAMVMNTGAYGDEIYDHVVYVDVLDLTTKNVNRIEKSVIDYGYRYSMFQTMNCVILGACFSLIEKPKAVIQQKMDTILAQRQSKLPIDPSAGSVFKRPDYHISVGEIIERMGLKGYKIGGAKISVKHGGVIINHNNATGADILALIRFMQDKVWDYCQVRLMLEQIIID
ncbi:UDP-N-acetylmuramate dehydrogenase [Facilibium subflavum]|uniref:UDP-N-acetylmuramate dehydrogenase n=1 Tax=Facilibium subflavum TaxID=2219058 RepID=UPI000E64C833|nr:UDP-N-acetylmuramate dehydrogenase [Facilibium subflavum]